MWKKLLKGLALGLLGLVLVAGIVMFWYFPHYVNQKEIRSIQPAAEKVTMVSCNVRCLTPLDLGQKSWFYRADLLLDDVAGQKPGIIGFQEATRWQYDYLVECLPEYDSVINYRDESVISEGCPIFYHQGLYSLVDKGSFWLSETPEVMSKDWGAAHYRICSYVILQEKTTEKEFVVFNTHLDHVSDEARIKGIGVVLDKIAQFGGLPSVIMGDLNAQEGSKTYESVTEHFMDARYVAQESEGSYTYQNWGNMDAAKRLDYFMVSMEGFAVQRYGVLPALHGEVYASDHCPIVMEAELN